MNTKLEEAEVNLSLLPGRAIDYCVWEPMIRQTAANVEGIVDGSPAPTAYTHVMHSNRAPTQ